MPSSAKQVFLCHSSGDKAVVRNLWARLRSEGHLPWLDEQALLPGQDWQLEIRKAVRQSQIVLVCLSKTSVNKSGYVQKEIRFALDAADEQPEGTIFLIPVRLEECEVPERLTRWQWVDLFQPDGYERLLGALETAPTSAPASTPPATAAPQAARGVRQEAEGKRERSSLAGRRLTWAWLSLIGVVAVAAGSVLAPRWVDSTSPLTVAFDVWQDLGREEKNVVKRSHEYVAVVIYGSDALDVRDINVDTILLSDGTGSAVPAAMFHLREGFDENNDGKDDLKLDYRIADLKSSENKLFTASTFRLTGRLKDSKGARPSAVSVRWQ